MEMGGSFGSNKARTLGSCSTLFFESGWIEGDQAGVIQFQTRGPREEFFVFGIGVGPAALNVVDAKLVQLLRDDEFVVDGKRDGFALACRPGELYRKFGFA